MKQLFFVLILGVMTVTSCNAGNNPQKPEAAANSTGEKAVNLITKEQFLKEIWNYEESPDEWKFLGDKPVILDFYADWCGPCKIASPILEEVAREYEGKVVVYKVDTQQERELAGVFGISSIPAFLYIPVEGKPMMTAGIGRSKEQTKQMFVDNIESHLLKQE
jgi:thioredoxin